MSNLSELLPAGAGAKSADFVASGTLSNGQTVVLNSDGTVSAVGESSIPQSVGSPVVFESAVTNYQGITFDSNANKIVISYRDEGNSNRGTAVVGTVSGTSISFGTPVVFSSANSIMTQAIFDSNENKVVIAYRGTSNYGYVVVGAVSGTSISFGTPLVYASVTANPGKMAFDSNSNKVVLPYQDYSIGGHGKALIGTVSGTSISFGTAVLFSASNVPSLSASFDSNANKVVISYYDYGNSQYGTAIVGTVSGTSISFGSAVVFQSEALLSTSATFDSDANKTVIATQSNNFPRPGKAIVGTVSGTNISFGSLVTFHSGDADQPRITFDSNSNKVVIVYRNDNSAQNGTLIVGTVSGTSISFGTPVVYESAATNYNIATFDSVSNKVVIAYQDAGNSSYGTSVVFKNAGTETNSANFIGITDQAIANTATGAVIFQGGVSNKVSGLTTGSDYYVQDDGSLSTTVSSVPAGRALSSTSILLEG